MLCVSGAAWADHPPVVLTLGPNHSVTITDTGSTIVYNGTESRSVGGLFPGMVAVPARYTPLDVSSPVTRAAPFHPVVLLVARQPRATIQLDPRV